MTTYLHLPQCRRAALHRPCWTHNSGKDPFGKFREVEEKETTNKRANANREDDLVPKAVSHGTHVNDLE